ncbi:uncharacterized protein LOC125722685 [Brienomyrus brachyistius]|uniref:uncharacterized protein LOC125722682 n=1 Tax=Brienomyrus brachyistius TaxID=42636 RepID=UPI0020B2594A|nr:uncharacterized protein LOC125722682 [Brienomyrus brachyistius]XP_048854842.1 uncharacterized protein LOC125722685 [Brienomyrus brachyistius]
MSRRSAWELPLSSGFLLLHEREPVTEELQPPLERYYFRPERLANRGARVVRDAIPRVPCTLKGATPVSPVRDLEGEHAASTTSFLSGRIGQKIFCTRFCLLRSCKKTEDCKSGKGSITQPHPVLQATGGATVLHKLDELQRFISGTAHATSCCSDPSLCGRAALCSLQCVHHQLPMAVISPLHRCRALVALPPLWALQAVACGEKYPAQTEIQSEPPSQSAGLHGQRR